MTPPTMRARSSKRWSAGSRTRTSRTSLVLPMWTARYGDYDDLARIKEWSAAGGLGLEEW